MISTPETISCGRHWYAVHTRSRHEKMVGSLLAERGIERFLPLVRTLSQWADRRKWVEKPVFPGYLFVRVHEEETPTVRETGGVVRLLGPEPSRPSIVPDAEVYYPGCPEGSGGDAHPQVPAVLHGDIGEALRTLGRGRSLRRGGPRTVA